ncbi:ABC transporter ATP-binding protein [Streptomyces profundus]|uniref:ABC transporter ATP-binding protein n=1 Tax=Streptomyces profundus TaxID=2867410 RepID=UPI001D162298|nr:ABC transporter ATP-binding protein [Streptomyces sp. MA3_2.13]UED85380.1 ABC transporter ATP-binding protein [Streptomyces sp. MA3_2.13]
MDVLRLADVAHGYGRRTVLASVSLTLTAGDRVALLGQNGSGKSTLLRIAAGRETPDAGTADFLGEPASEDRPEFRAGVACALAPGACYPDLTVREHLLLVALAHAVPDAEALVDEALAGHRLSGHADELPNVLSAGLTQLLSLAATRVRPRALLILDEPEAHLDELARAELAERLNQEAAEGTAILLATHDATLADRITDRQYTLLDGALLPHTPTAARDD